MPAGSSETERIKVFCVAPLSICRAGSGGTDSVVSVIDTWVIPVADRIPFISVIALSAAAEEASAEIENLAFGVPVTLTMYVPKPSPSIDATGTDSASRAATSSC